MERSWISPVAARMGTAGGSLFCGFSALLSLCLGVGAAIWSAAQPQFTMLQATALFGLFVGLGVVLAQFFYDLEGWFEQDRRDRRAAALFSALENGEPADPFVLYLRPFASTDRIAEEHVRAVKISAVPGAGPTFATGSDRIEFEAEIETALRKIGPLVALGQPLEHMGAGRIRVADDAWRPAIRALLDAASLVVLLPSPNPGTVWEVEQILSGDVLSKTIIVDPPNDRGARVKGYDPTAEWSHIRAAFHTHGYALPEDDPEGRLLYFGTSRTPQREERLAFGAEGTIRRFALSVLKDNRSAKAA